MMRTRAVITALLFALSSLARAEITPTSSPSDPEFQHVPYSVTPHVIHIKVKAGEGFEIKVREDDIDYWMGQRDDWVVKVKGGTLSAKAKVPLAGGNLKIFSKSKPDTVQYWFRIEDITDKKGVAMWHLDFDYPPEPPKPEAEIDPVTAAAQKVDHDAQFVKDHLALEADESPKHIQRQRNGDYSVIGSSELTPTSAYDNGELTVLTFAPDNPLPSIFIKESDGTETRVMVSIQNDMMVIPRVARKFVLRHGSEVACLINGSFHPIGNNTHTHTVSDDVIREVKEKD